MKNPYYLLLSVLIALSAHAQPVESPRRHALVVGNANYSIGAALVNPVNDANAVASTLAKLGFSVTKVLDVRRADFEMIIDEFASKVQKGDVALVYYAGHGIQVRGENFLLPVDFAAQDATQARYQSLPLNLIVDRISLRYVRVAMFVLDACRNNPFAGSGRSLSTGLAAVNAAAGSYFAYATAPGSVASDGQGRANGLFTSHLLSALSGPNLDIDHVFSEVRERVYQDSHGEQLPWIASSLIGSFSFSAAATWTSPPVQFPGTNANAVSNEVRVDGARGQELRATAVVGQCHELAQSTITRSMRNMAGGLLDAAISDLGRSLEGCQDAQMLLTRAIALGQQGNYAAAVADLDRAVRLAPSSQTYAARANARLAAGQYAEAQRDCELAIELDPRNPIAYIVRGRVRRATGDVVAALDDYRRAAELGTRKSF